MSENWKISSRQFKILVLMSYLGSSILLSPGVFAHEAKQDAWIGSIIGGIIGVVYVLFYNYLGGFLSKMTFVEYIQFLLGKWFGKIVALLFVLYLLIDCAILVFEVGDFYTTQILISTPIEVIMGLIVLVATIGIRLGLETFSRASEMFYPYIVTLLLVLIILLLKDVEIVNIQPVFEHGFKPTLRSGIIHMSFTASTFIVLMMIFPAYVNNQNIAKKAFLRGAMLGGLIIIIITVLSISVLGHDLTARNTFPIYALSKKISIGNFLERIEAISSTIWLIATFFKILLFFFGTVIGLSQILQLKDYRPLTWPIALILLILSLVIYPNVVYETNWLTKIWLPFVSTFAFVLPVFLIIIDKSRKNKEKHKK